MKAIKAKSFFAGIHVKDMKSLACNCPTEVMPDPAVAYISLRQSLGKPAVAIVEKGQKVKEGELIAKADGAISSDIFASIAGEVTDITELDCAGCKESFIVIKGDGSGEKSYFPPLKDATADEIKARIRDCGIVGLGGAAFPTAVKIAPKTPVDTLILNGAECEPYLTCDHRLMLEHTEEIARGARYLAKALGVSRIIIGIEANKPRAIEKMKNLTASLEGFTVATLPSVYPQGAEKVLIEQVTGKEVPQGALPASVGVIVMNVASVGFIARYLKTGMPLVTKRITVDGDAVAKAQNVEVVIGTQVKDVIEFCGGYSQEPGKIIYGGPMMGTALTSDEMPIIKQNNAVLVFGKEKAVMPAINPCIRCGRCISACPMGLAPVEIALALSVKDSEELKALCVDLCMECGSCSFVCPAKRPVAQTMKEAKDFLRKADKKN